MVRLAIKAESYCGICGSVVGQVHTLTGSCQASGRSTSPLRNKHANKGP